MADFEDLLRNRIQKIVGADAVLNVRWGDDQNFSVVGRNIVDFSVSDDCVEFVLGHQRVLIPFHAIRLVSINPA